MALLVASVPRLVTLPAVAAVLGVPRYKLVCVSYSHEGNNQ